MNSLHNETMKLSFPSQGEAFAEDSMAIAQDFLPECESPYNIHILGILSNTSTEPALDARRPIFYGFASAYG
jgi:hypothetical protein